MNKINLDAIFEFLDDEKVKENEAEASISLNPLFSWAKIVVTDSRPNANKQRIPEEEFNNLIKTGLYAPIKMYPGSVAEGHENSIPLGVISHLKKVGDKVIALAALWKRERPNDIELLKKMYEEGNSPNVSWEIAYGSSSTDEEGVESLYDTILNSLVVVGRPAYKGRTAFIAMAGEDGDNKNSEDNKKAMEELEKLQEQLDALNKELETVKTELQAEKESKASFESELTELREYKAAIESEKEKKNRIDAIKQKFSEAGLSLEENYFDENGEKLLAMSEESLDFVIQEFVAFSSKRSVIETEASRNKVPNVISTNAKLTPKELVDSIKNLKK